MAQAAMTATSFDLPGSGPPGTQASRGAPSGRAGGDVELGRLSQVGWDAAKERDSGASFPRPVSQQVVQPLPNPGSIHGHPASNTALSHTRSSRVPSRQHLIATGPAGAPPSFASKDIPGIIGLEMLGAAASSLQLGSSTRNIPHSVTSHSLACPTQEGLEIIDSIPGNAVAALEAQQQQPDYQRYESFRGRCLANVLGPHIPERVAGFLLGKEWAIFTILLTLACLYITDIMKVAGGREQAAEGTSAFMLFAFITFSIELLLSSIFVEGYFFSFFFWVDIIGTFSLVFDIQWIAAGLLSTKNSNVIQISRAGRAARVGSQLGRVTRIVRILRLFRATRFVKIWQVQNRAANQVDNPLGPDTPTGNDGQPLKPTVLGELLAEATTRKCVIIILFVLVVATFLETEVPNASDYSAVQLVSHDVMPWQDFVDSSPYPVLFMSIVSALNGSVTTYVPFTANNYREEQILKVEVECALYLSNGSSVTCPYPVTQSQVWYDMTSLTQLNAGLSMVLTSVILVTLVVSAYAFGKDATKYVIVPIETMLAYLRRVCSLGVDDGESVHAAHNNDRPETSLLAQYVMRLVTEIDDSRKKAEEERHISDTLLNSMVPPGIARQLKDLRWWEGTDLSLTIADSFQDTTVLFTDIVGFTSFSARVSPEEAMRCLNHMYSLFDQVVEKYGLYKVETIGDSYMLVGGAPDETPDHAERVAMAALEIKASVPALQEIVGEKEINVRIGMHSGPVTAGVIGFKNPRWHLFGDTCNTASRMESTGIAGEVQLSHTTYERIRSAFVCTVRGKIAVKGKGEMVTYLLVKQRQGSLARSGSERAQTEAEAALSAGGAHNGGLPGGMDRDAFLASPQFKKAQERYNAAKAALVQEEEQLVKLLKQVEAMGSSPSPRGQGPTSQQQVAVGAAAPPNTPAGGHGAAAHRLALPPVMVPSLLAKMPIEDFKLAVVGSQGEAPDTSSPRDSDLQQLAVYLHEELANSRRLIQEYSMDRAATQRMKAIKRVYEQMVLHSDMALADMFSIILDMLYKCVECDVIKIYVVDHLGGQLCPVSRGTVYDMGRPIPLHGTLAGRCVSSGAAARYDDVHKEGCFNVELEEVPGYTSKSMMVLPILQQRGAHQQQQQHHKLAGSGSPRKSAQIGDLARDQPRAGAPSSVQVVAVVVAINRWQGWDQVSHESERSITNFTDQDEQAMQEAVDSISTLLHKRRSEILLEAGSGLIMAAARPKGLVKQRLAKVSRRRSSMLVNLQVNFLTFKEDELLGVARDLLQAFQLPERLALPEGALPTFLARLAEEHDPGQYFNMGHAVSVLQGVFVTHMGSPQPLDQLLGPRLCSALLLAALMVDLGRANDVMRPSSGVGAATLALQSKEVSRSMKGAARRQGFATLMGRVIHGDVDLLGALPLEDSEHIRHLVLDLVSCRRSSTHALLASPHLQRGRSAVDLLQPHRLSPAPQLLAMAAVTRISEGSPLTMQAPGTEGSAAAAATSTGADDEGAAAAKAVCSLLLLAWSEQQHLKDYPTALALMAARNADLTGVTTQVVMGPVSGSSCGEGSGLVLQRTGSSSHLGPGGQLTMDAVQMLLREVSRMQVEVLPLWSRVAELFPHLQPQLATIQANKAKYLQVISSYHAMQRAAPPMLSLKSGPAGGSEADPGSPAGSPAAYDQVQSPSSSFTEGLRGVPRCMRRCSTSNSSRASRVMPSDDVATLSRGDLSLSSRLLFLEQRAGRLHSSFSVMPRGLLSSASDPAHASDTAAVTVVVEGGAEGEADRRSGGALAAACSLPATLPSPTGAAAVAVKASGLLGRVGKGSATAAAVVGGLRKPSLLSPVPRSQPAIQASQQGGTPPVRHGSSLYDSDALSGVQPAESGVAGAALALSRKPSSVFARISGGIAAAARGFIEENILVVAASSPSSNNPAGATACSSGFLPSPRVPMSGANSYSHGYNQGHSHSGPLPLPTRSPFSATAAIAIGSTQGARSMTGPSPAVMLPRISATDSLQPPAKAQQQHQQSDGAGRRVRRASAGVMGSQGRAAGGDGGIGSGGSGGGAFAALGDLAMALVGWGNNNAAGGGTSGGRTPEAPGSSVAIDRHTTGGRSNTAGKRGLWHMLSSIKRRADDPAAGHSSGTAGPQALPILPATMPDVSLALGAGDPNTAASAAWVAVEARCSGQVEHPRPRSGLEPSRSVYLTPGARAPQRSAGPSSPQPSRKALHISLPSPAPGPILNPNAFTPLGTSSHSQNLGSAQNSGYGWPNSGQPVDGVVFNREDAQLLAAMSALAAGTAPGTGRSRRMSRRFGSNTSREVYRRTIDGSGHGGNMYMEGRITAGGGGRGVAVHSALGSPHDHAPRAHSVAFASAGGDNSAWGHRHVESAVASPAASGGTGASPGVTGSAAVTSPAWQQGGHHRQQPPAQHMAAGSSAAGPASPHDIIPSQAARRGPFAPRRSISGSPAAVPADALRRSWNDRPSAPGTYLQLGPSPLNPAANPQRLQPASASTPNSPSPQGLALGHMPASTSPGPYPLQLQARSAVPGALKGAGGMAAAGDPYATALSAEPPRGADMTRLTPIVSGFALDTCGSLPSEDEPTLHLSPAALQEAGTGGSAANPGLASPGQRQQARLDPASSAPAEPPQLGAAHSGGRDGDGALTPTCSDSSSSGPWASVAPAQHQHQPQYQQGYAQLQQPTRQQQAVPVGAAGSSSLQLVDSESCHMITLAENLISFEGVTFSGHQLNVVREATEEWPPSAAASTVHGSIGGGSVHLSVAESPAGPPVVLMPSQRQARGSPVLLQGSRSGVAPSLGPSPPPKTRAEGPAVSMAAGGAGSAGPVPPPLLGPRGAEGVDGAATAGVLMEPTLAAAPKAASGGHESGPGSLSFMLKQPQESAQPGPGSGLGGE